MRNVVLKQKSVSEQLKMENMGFKDVVNTLEFEIKQFQNGEKGKEHQANLNKEKARIKNLERLLVREKEDGMKIKEEYKKTMNFLKNGLLFNFIVFYK